MFQSISNLLCCRRRRPAAPHTAVSHTAASDLTFSALNVEDKKELNTHLKQVQNEEYLSDWRNRAWSAARLICGPIAGSIYAYGYYEIVRNKFALPLVVCCVLANGGQVSAYFLPTLKHVLDSTKTMFQGKWNHLSLYRKSVMLLAFAAGMYGALASSAPFYQTAKSNGLSGSLAILFDGLLGELNAVSIGMTIVLVAYLWQMRTACAPDQQLRRNLEVALIKDHLAQLERLVLKSRGNDALLQVLKAVSPSIESGDLLPIFSLLERSASEHLGFQYRATQNSTVCSKILKWIAAGCIFVPMAVLGTQYAFSQYGDALTLSKGQAIFTVATTYLREAFWIALAPEAIASVFYLGWHERFPFLYQLSGLLGLGVTAGTFPAAYSSAEASFEKFPFQFLDRLLIPRKLGNRLIPIGMNAAPTVKLFQMIPDVLTYIHHRYYSEDYFSDEIWRLCLALVRDLKGLIDSNKLSNQEIHNIHTQVSRISMSWFLESRLSTGKGVELLNLSTPLLGGGSPSQADTAMVFSHPVIEDRFGVLNPLSSLLTRIKNRLSQAEPGTGADQPLSTSTLFLSSLVSQPVESDSRTYLDVA